MTPEEEVYRKLFRALEEDAAKQESEVLDHLRKRFSLTGSRPVSTELVAKGVPAIDVFAEVLRVVSPFARMLSEIYAFLADRRSTVAGKADKFAFRFAELKERVAFPLDAFPKTWVEVAATAALSTAVVDPDARDDLLVDTPVYTAEVNALENLGTHPLLELVADLAAQRASDRAAQALLARHPDIVAELSALSNEAIKAAARSLVYRPDTTLRANFRRLGPHLYFRDPQSLEAWNADLAAARRSDREHAAGNLYWEFRRTDRLFDLTGLHTFVERSHDPSQPATDSAEVFDRWIELFRRAADAALKRFDDQVEVMSRVADEVIIPFWRHRWRLYEVWALTLVLQRPPPTAASSLHLERRADDRAGFDWPIPHGDARKPVGVFRSALDRLDVWFQRKTAASGGGHIEPDIRVMTSSEDDVLIVELKDRHLAGARHPRDVANLYAIESAAQLVVVANYSPFRGSFASADPERWRHGGADIIVAETLRPADVPAEVLDAVDVALAAALPPVRTWDLLLDVSGSMSRVDSARAVRNLIDEKGAPRAAWSFSDTLRAIPGDPHVSLPTPGGVTHAQSALEKYLEAGGRDSVLSVVVVTDEDGAAQLGSAVRDPKIEVRVL